MDRATYLRDASSSRRRRIGPRRRTDLGQTWSVWNDTRDRNSGTSLEASSPRAFARRTERRCSSFTTCERVSQCANVDRDERTHPKPPGHGLPRPAPETNQRTVKLNMPKKAASRRHTSAERGRRHKASDGELVRRSVPMERTTRKKQKKQASKPERRR